MTSGLFVVLEGGDGAGKTTQVSRLEAWLRAAGRDVVVTYEPGDTRVGATIRRLLLDPETGDLAARAEALLYAADKAQHVAEVVQPALARGAVVVCDRYLDSMVAYQGAGRVLDADEVLRLGSWATGGLLPDLTVLLDVEVARAVGQKDRLDRVEAAGTDFHERVRQHFLALAAHDPQRYLVLDGRAPIEVVEQQIRTRVEALLAR
ncbi:MAG: dTMP kinase [Actinomycetia bacterium]|nr:dTMP kinase [Actinomycetes bacterium]